jgi:hypothetical protein
MIDRSKESSEQDRSIPVQEVPVPAVALRKLIDLARLFDWLIAGTEKNFFNFYKISRKEHVFNIREYSGYSTCWYRKDLPVI